MCLLFLLSCLIFDILSFLCVCPFREIPPTCPPYIRAVLCTSVKTTRDSPLMNDTLMEAYSFKRIEVIWLFASSLYTHTDAPVGIYI